MRTSPLIAPTGLLVLVLAGCAQTAAPPPTATAGAPPSFPRVEGTVLSTTETAPGDWRIRVRVVDASDAFASARSLLTSDGYQLTDDEPVADGGQGQACTTALCVTFDVLRDAGGTPTIEYEVFHSTGMSG